MAITFTTAPTVVEGTRPTSGDFNKLAAAFNDRLRSGLGDPTWRIWFKAYSMFRALIAPDGDLTPAEDEWFKIWMHVPPEDGFSSNAPTPTHPWTRWAAGDGGLDAEDVRINAVPSSPDDAVDTAWSNGKAQRGYVASTGAHAAPAFEASVAHYNIYSWALIDASGLTDHSGTAPTAAIQNLTSYKFFKTFGGYCASPTRVQCGTDPDHYVAVRSFRNLRDNSVVTYSTCDASDPIELAQIEYGASEYILYGANSVLDDPEDPESGTHYEYFVTARLPYHTWLEGPYAGTAFLQKQNGWQWNEVLCRYLQGFRGSVTQRASDGFSIRSIGFDYQKFFTCQYRLAPAYAEDLGGGSLDARYAKAQFTTPAAEGSGATFVDGFADLMDGFSGYHFETIDGFGMAGYRVHAEGLTEPVRVVFVDLEEGTGDIHLVINNGDAVTWLETPVRKYFGVYLDVGQTLPEGAVVWIEFAHLQIYRPDLADAYVVLRRGTTGGGAGACDTQGEWFDDCVSFGRSYFLKGHILCTDDVPAVDETALNATPIYEAARKMLKDRMRFLDRDQLVDYSVVDGKSVLVFDRFLSFGGHDYDLFDGIAPPNAAIESGKILAGVEYKVRGASGTLDYNSVSYDIDDTFTGVDGVSTYTVSEGGDAAPWQVNGILSTGPEKGRANEWLMFMSFCPYGGTGYEDDDYNDVYGFLMNRCMINSAHLDPLVDPDMVGHFCANTSGALCVKPEAPSGFNYAAGMNASGDANFFEACPVYPADYECEKVEMDYETNQVTITFKTRFRHSADSGVRTDENGVTDYLAIGGGECPTKSGDVATDAPDAPTHGACKPRFYFTKLAPVVFEDTDNVQQSHDTRLIADEVLWLNFMLEAMCEGYLDIGAATDLCDRQPCYTFPNLCFQALGHRWFRLLPGRLFDGFRQGFGTMPELKLYREGFNDLATCLNKLTTLALEIPRSLEYRTKHTYGYTPIAPGMSAGALGESALKETIGHGDLEFESAIIDDWTAWAAVTTFSPGSTPCGYECGYQDGEVVEVSGVSIGSGIATATTGGPSVNWWKPTDDWPYVVAQRWRLQLRMSLASLNMLSSDLRDLLDTSGALSVHLVNNRTWAVMVNGDGDPICGDANANWGFPGKRTNYEVNNVPSCVGVPFTTADDGEPIEVNAELLGDPITHQFSLVRIFGYNGSLFGNCTWGAATNSYVAGIGYLTIVVPLV